MTKNIADEDDQVLVERERLQYLRWRESKLEALEAAGVDNWDGYEFAMAEWQK